VMEAWDPSIKSNTTFSHAWGSAPANVVPRFVAGVRPLAPGAREVLIAPQPGPLDWLRAKVPTIRGPIEVALDRRDGFRLVVDLPANVTGRIELDLAQLGVADARALHVRSEGRAPRDRIADGRLVVDQVEPGRTIVGSDNRG
ncbi:alpha-L-rhamnosidase C-terminal domain-containing protein, partial [Micromonospora sp. NPDC051296]|uniref:alpha-L-rhamnosidase C-terminal domain-containing protein n=1 Tax=Micromonospora sp. NPDC051296 TaxID=3155046 RepID=UPI00341A8F8B